MTITETRPLKLTPEEKIQLLPAVRTLRDEGKSDGQMAEVLGLTRDVVRAIRIIGDVAPAYRKPWNRGRGTSPRSRKTIGIRAGDELPCPAGGHDAIIAAGGVIEEHKRLSDQRVEGIYYAERCPSSGDPYPRRVAA